MSVDYFKRFNALPTQTASKPSDELKLIVVIPCFAETECHLAVQSLYNTNFPKSQFEVIVVINHSENAGSTNVAKNRETETLLTNYFGEQSNFHIIRAYNLPQKHAGVGWARKIGMDEACRRFKQIQSDGTIVCYDADSLCSENYLDSISTHFENPKINGASIRFEHPLNGSLSDENYEAIIRYELFLRYYNCGLRYALLPYAFHTVGSSMAVRCSAYMKQGGMNRRKAGEDFYFLHKIIQLGNFIEITDCKVIPSSRSSNRVPFGTGKAVGKFLEMTDDLSLSYDFSTFESLRTLQENVSDIYNGDYTELDEHLRSFIFVNELDASFAELQTNTRDFSSFKERFHQVFDAFKCLKYVHWYRENISGAHDLRAQSNRLLHAFGVYPESDSYLNLLLTYRKFEHSNKFV